ncbi:ABC transporter ATP-binding protein [Microbacterium sp. CGR1]
MTASPDDRTDQVADAAPSTAKTTPARKTPAKKATSARTPAKSAADKAAATIEVVVEPALKIDRSAAPTAPRLATANKAPSTTARTAAAKDSARPAGARGTAAKTTTARSTTAKTTAAKTTAAKTAAAKTAAAKTAAAKTTAAKTAAAKTTAAKTAAAKAAAEKSAAAKSTARTSAAKTASARTTAAKTAAAKTAAAKAAAAKAAEVEAEEAKAAEARVAEAKAAEAQAAEAQAAAPQAAAAQAAEATAIVLDDATDARADGAEEVSSVVEEPRVDDVAAPAVESPAADAAPLEGVAADFDVYDDPTAEGSADENPVSEDDDAVSDADATDEAVSGVEAASGSEAIRIRGLVKSFGDHTAVNGIDLTVPAGSFYGIVGPNGAGKTTTLSIVAGLLRADEGNVVICGIDQAAKPLAAKRMMGVLPDRLRTFDRLTGRQLLYYYGLLRGLASNVIEKRVGDLARAFDLGEALNRVVSDYSAGMTKKIMLAGAMIHSPRVLVLDEPFEAVDPVSSAVILDILRAYVDHGGTVILSSHGMDLVARVCSRVAIIVGGEVLAEGTIDDVRAGQTLEARFVELSGGISEVEGLEWLHTFSD